MPSNLDDMIDSRDVIDRIAELESIDIEAAEMDADLPEGVTQYGLDEAERQELDELRELAKQGEDSAEDWEYGATLIRYSSLRNYAMELAEELGAIPSEYTWPTSCIDWERATRELQMDYTAVDYAGVTYWVR